MFPAFQTDYVIDETTNLLHSIQKVKLKKPDKKRSKTARLHFLTRRYYHELRYSVIQTGAGIQA